MRMNIHSHIVQAMDHSPQDRQSRILDAAQRSFGRAGMHQATMADVAREAGMTAGNLYRYYSNKDAIIAAIAERDRHGLVHDFMALNAGEPSLDNFEALGRKHLVHEPSWRMAMIVELWAEAARNPVVRSICSGCEATLYKNMTDFIERARLAGIVPPGIVTHVAVMQILMLADGMIRLRASSPDADPAPIADIFFATVRTLLTTPPVTGPAA